MSITKNMLLNSYPSMKKTQKDSDDFWSTKLTLKGQILALFDSSPLHQFAKFNEFLWLQLIFSQKNFLILYPSLENSTTSIAIPDNHTQGNNISETQLHWIHPMDWKSFSFWIQLHLTVLEIWSAQKIFEA